MPHEDGALKKLLLIHGPIWEIIGKQIGRHPLSCRDRYKTIRSFKLQGKWAEDEVERLFSAVTELTQNRQQGRPLWAEVADRVGTRSVHQCIDKWHLDLSYRKYKKCNPWRWTPFEDFKLVSALYELGVSDETEIRWKTILRGGVHIRVPPSLKLRWNILKKRVPHHVSATEDLDLIMEELLRQLHPSEDDWLKLDPDIPDSAQETQPDKQTLDQGSD